jgi:hypothetical protein
MLVHYLSKAKSYASMPARGAQMRSVEMVMWLLLN